MQHVQDDQLLSNIRILMAVRGMGRAELATKAGMNYMTLAHIMQGKSNVTSKSLTRLAKGLDVDVVDLFKRDLINLK